MLNHNLHILLQDMTIAFHIFLKESHRLLRFEEIFTCISRIAYVTYAKKMCHQFEESTDKISSQICDHFTSLLLHNLLFEIDSGM